MSTRALELLADIVDEEGMTAAMLPGQIRRALARASAEATKEGLVGKVDLSKPLPKHKPHIVMPPPDVTPEARFCVHGEYVGKCGYAPDDAECNPPPPPKPAAGEARCYCSKGLLATIHVASCPLFVPPAPSPMVTEHQDYLVVTGTTPGYGVTPEPMGAASEVPLEYLRDWDKALKRHHPKPDQPEASAASDVPVLHGPSECIAWLRKEADEHDDYGTLPEKREHADKLRTIAADYERVERERDVLASTLTKAQASIKTLAVNAKRVVEERDKAQADVRFMVERAANEKLDGYRELGQRAAKAEAERDALQKQLDDANYWRERHSDENVAYGKQAQERWKQLKQAEAARDAAIAALAKLKEK